MQNISFVSWIKKESCCDGCFSNYWVTGLFPPPLSFKSIPGRPSTKVQGQKGKRNWLPLYAGCFVTKLCTFVGGAVLLRGEIFHDCGDFYTTSTARFGRVLPKTFHECRLCTTTVHTDRFFMPLGWPKNVWDFSKSKNTMGTGVFPLSSSKSFRKTQNR